MDGMDSKMHEQLIGFIERAKGEGKESLFHILQMSISIPKYIRKFGSINNGKYFESKV